MIIYLFNNFIFYRTDMYIYAVDPLSNAIIDMEDLHKYDTFLISP